jgi:tetratricopeptide (TPR) repeat protein
MWQRSLEIGPNYGAFSNSGSIYFMKELYGDAARMYEKALELNYHDYRVRMNLASAYYWIPEKRDTALATYWQAIDMAERIKTVNTNNPELLSHLAECYAKVGERQKAMESIEMAQMLASENILIMVSAGLVYEIFGQREKALEQIVKAIASGYPERLIRGFPEFKRLVADSRFMQDSAS